MPVSRIFNDIGFCTFSICVAWFIALAGSLVVMMNCQQPPQPIATPFGGEFAETSPASFEIRSTPRLLADPNQSPRRASTFEIHPVNDRPRNCAESRVFLV